MQKGGRVFVAWDFSERKKANVLGKKNFAKVRKKKREQEPITKKVCGEQEAKKKKRLLSFIQNKREAKGLVDGDHHKKNKRWCLAFTHDKRWATITQNKRWAMRCLGLRT